MSEGINSFSQTATDAAGNASTKSFSITKDAVPPSLSTNSVYNKIASAQTGLITTSTTQNVTDTTGLASIVATSWSIERNAAGVVPATNTGTNKLSGEACTATKLSDTSVKLSCTLSVSDLISTFDPGGATACGNGVTEKHRTKINYTAVDKVGNTRTSTMTLSVGKCL